MTLVVVSTGTLSQRLRAAGEGVRSVACLVGDLLTAARLGPRAVGGGVCAGWGRLWFMFGVAVMFWWAVVSHRWPVVHLVGVPFPR